MSKCRRRPVRGGTGTSAAAARARNLHAASLGSSFRSSIRSSTPILTPTFDSENGTMMMTESPQTILGLTAEDSFPAPKWYFQQMLWVQNPWHPENFAYNYPLALHMRGPLDRSALERSIQEIVRRHQPLRSVFRIMEGRLIQIVLPPQPQQLPVVDLSHVCDAGREAEALRLAVADANRPFDLSQGPLLRAKLGCFGAEDHLLRLTTHHIVSDNWSMAILLRELSVTYGAFSAGQPSPLA